LRFLQRWHSKIDVWLSRQIASSSANFEASGGIAMHANVSRRDVLGLIAAGVSGAAMPALAGPARFTEEDYKKATVIDAQGGFDPVLDMDRTAAATAESGLTAISLTMGLVGNGSHRFDSVLEDIADANGWIQQYPQAFMSLLRASDLAAAKQSGRTGIIYNLQDTSSLEGDINRVALLKYLGVRIIQLTYNKRNLCGDGCLEPENAGLSDFGHQVVAQINASRILLDLSHGGRRTISEAAKVSKVPPAVTHTACRNLVDNQRNMYDDQMREIAQMGGVVGIYFIAYLRSGIGQPALNARREDLIAHLDHAVNVCGEDHVGLGTDGSVSTLVVDAAALANQKKRFEERTKQGFATAGEGPDVFNYVQGYNTPRRLFALAQDLSQRGWSNGRIEKIIGGNFARLFSATWDA
jgi:membrane dipeptidase